MKTTSMLIHLIALSACFLIATSGAFKMSGVRRALQTMSPNQIAIQIVPPEASTFAL